MFCGKCGHGNNDGVSFCAKCGNQMSSTMQPTHPPLPAPSTPGNGYSVAGIICGAIAFLVFPIVLCPIGLILGAVGKSKGESKAVVAMVVSALGLVIGMILGAIVFSSTASF